jgi:DNA-binding transcriptional regulator YhcF (GntR family)
MRIHIDRELPVPVPLQLQGQIEFGVTNGDFVAGTRLPSVRALSADLAMSPVTVAAVFRTLRQRGVIETIPGRGTFVRSDIGREPALLDDPLDVALRQVLRRAERAGVGRGELIARLQRLVARAHGGPAVRATFVGVYPAVTRAYVADLRRHLGAGDELTPTTFDALSGAPAADLVDRDLLFTFAHRVADLERLAPAGVTIASVGLIPSERTRVALAEVDPAARVVLVSTVAAFVVTFRRGIERFASHVASVRACVRGSAEAAAYLGDADVVVYATGSEDVVDGLAADVRAFEYRHVPDPVHVERTLIPLVDRVRAVKARASHPQEAR